MPIRLGQTGGVRLGGVRLGQTGGIRAPGARRRLSTTLSRPEEEEESYRVGAYRGGGRSIAEMGPGGETIRRELVGRTSRPSPFLSVATRVLSAPSNALLGFFNGYTDHKFSKDPGKYIATEPWEFFKAIGAGFREVPDAVMKDEGMEIIETSLQARYGTESFIGRHAGTISFTTAIVTDPTMYLTFGATAPSRIAAKRILDHSSGSSMAEAQAIMKSGGVLDGKKFTTVQQAMAYTHAKNGRPFTMGDALDQAKTMSADARTGLKIGRVKIASRPPRFGRGVKFMGLPVPGTPELSEYLAKAVRGKSEELYKTKPYQMLLAGVPNHVLHHIGNDMLRANLASKFTDFRRVHEQVGEQAAEDSISYILKPLSDQVNDISLGPTSRKGVHRKPPQAVADPTLNTMRRRIESVRVRTTNAAVRAGLSAGDMDNMWDDIAKRYDDPLDAAAHFSVKAATRTSFQQFKNQILEDPRFAREITGRPNVLAAPIGVERIMGEIPHTHGKRKFLVPSEVDEALDAMKNQALQDVELSKWLRALNWPQNKWKTFATVMNPAFFTMNFVGAVFNNMLAAVVNPMDYVRAVGMVMKDRMGQTPETMLEAQARGIGGLQSFISVEAAPNVSLLEQFGQTEMSLGRAVKEQTLGGLAKRAKGVAKPQLGVSKRRFTARRGRQATGVALAATGNPLAAVAFGPEIANIGRSVNSAIEDVVRLAPFQKAARDKELKQILEAYGPVQVPGMTHPRFANQEQKVMYDIGADISNHFQFDYRELTEMERRFAKTMMPFYTFFKKNFKLQMEQLVQQPRNLVAWDAFTNYMNEELDSSLPEEFRAVLPEYFDNLEAFNMPVPAAIRKKLGLPADQPLYLNPKLPFITLNMFPPFWDLFRETGEPFPQKLMRLTAPVSGMVGPLAPTPFPGAKTMFEYVTNSQLGLARPIDFQRANSNDWRNTYRDAPGWVQYLPEEMQKWLGVVPTKGGRKLMTSSRIYVLDQMATPFINNLGQSLPVEGATEHQVEQAKADRISWMTGVRLMPVDLLKLHRSWGYRLVDLLEAQKQELKEQGRPMDPEDEISLRMLRQEVRILEEAWDIREEELYGSP